MAEEGYNVTIRIPSDGCNNPSSALTTYNTRIPLNYLRSMSDGSYWKEEFSNKLIDKTTGSTDITFTLDPVGYATGYKLKWAPLWNSQAENEYQLYVCPTYRSGHNISTTNTSWNTTTKLSTVTKTYTPISNVNFNQKIVTSGTFRDLTSFNPSTSFHNIYYADNSVISSGKVYPIGFTRELFQWLFMNKDYISIFWDADKRNTPVYNADYFISQDLPKLPESTALNKEVDLYYFIPPSIRNLPDFKIVSFDIRLTPYTVTMKKYDTGAYKSTGAWSADIGGSATPQSDPYYYDRLWTVRNMYSAAGYVTDISTTVHVNNLSDNGVPDTTTYSLCVLKNADFKGMGVGFKKLNDQHVIVSVNNFLGNYDRNKCYYGILDFFINFLNITYSYTTTTTSVITTTTTTGYTNSGKYLRFYNEPHQIITWRNLYSGISGSFTDAQQGYSAYYEGSPCYISIKDTSGHNHVPVRWWYPITTLNGARDTEIGNINYGQDVSSGYLTDGVSFLTPYGYYKGTASNPGLDNYDIDFLISDTNNSLTRDTNLHIESTKISFDVYAGQNYQTKILTNRFMGLYAYQYAVQGGLVDNTKVCYLNKISALRNVQITFSTNNDDSDYPVTITVYKRYGTPSNYSDSTSYTGQSGNKVAPTISNNYFFQLGGISSNTPSNVYREAKTVTASASITLSVNQTYMWPQTFTTTISLGSISSTISAHVAAIPVKLWYNSTSSQGIPWSNISLVTDTSSTSSANSTTSSSSISNKSFSWVKGSKITSCKAHRSFISRSYSSYRRYYYRPKVVYNIDNGTDYTLQYGNYTYYSPDNGEDFYLSTSSLNTINSRTGQTSDRGVNILFAVELSYFTAPKVQTCTDAGNWKRYCRVYNPNPVSLTLYYSSNKTKSKTSCNSSKSSTTISGYGTTTLTIQDQGGYDDEWILFAFYCSGEYLYTTIDEDVTSGTPNVVSSSWSSSI